MTHDQLRREEQFVQRILRPVAALLMRAPRAFHLHHAFTGLRLCRRTSTMAGLRPVAICEDVGSS
ncbi:MAG: hypothetical protein CMD83_19375 [Gammaproteobacteria bacterium]|nr:hypothetical protein [Gammaproteobacteria bacterium]